MSSAPNIDASCKLFRHYLRRAQLRRTLSPGASRRPITYFLQLVGSYRAAFRGQFGFRAAMRSGVNKPGASRPRRRSGRGVHPPPASAAIRSPSRRAPFIGRIPRASANLPTLPGHAILSRSAAGALCGRRESGAKPAGEQDDFLMPRLNAGRKRKAQGA
jgi:hypothetical protein